MIREYSWKDWMSVPQNKELYKRNMKEGLRQFQLEKKRRDDQIRYAEFMMQRNQTQWSWWWWWWSSCFINTSNGCGSNIISCKDTYR
jgi:hypothetical protein